MSGVLGGGPDASWEDIEQGADALLGKTFEEIGEDRDFEVPVTQSKSLLGDIIQEDYFRITKNPDAAPDFKKEGIELKVTPLEPMADAQRLQQKEAMALSQIDYNEMCDNEHWTDVSKLTNKLSRTLIIWYLHLEDEVTDSDNPTEAKKGAARAEYPIVWWHLWEPLTSQPEWIQDDYSTLRNAALEGKHLSRSMTPKLSSISKHSGDANFDKENPENSDPGALSEHPHLEYARKNGYYIDGGLIEVLAESAGLEVLTSNRGTPQLDRNSLLQKMEEKAQGDPVNFRRDHRLDNF